MEKIKYNKAFKKLLSEYEIDIHSNMDIEIPKEVKDIVAKDIILSNQWIYWKENWPLIKEEYLNDNICYDEKSDNHFHVDWYISPMNSEKCFKLWIKICFLLQQKFIRLWFKGIIITYSFHTPEMSKALERNLWFNTEWEEYCIWDEVSFYKMREWHNILSGDDFETEYWALMSIEI